MTNNEVTTGGGAYDLPDDVYSPEEATAAINKLNAAWLKDEQHPYINANHPQHQEFQDAVNKLYRVKFQDAGKLTPLQKAMSEALTEQAEQQQEMISESQEMIDELSENFGWDYFDIETIIDENDPILPCERDCLSMLLEVEKGQWDDAISRLDRSLVQHRKAPSEIIAAMYNLNKLHKENAEHEVKRNHALVVLQYLRDAGRAKQGLKPRQPLSGGNDYDNAY